jgi:hypothetical protein
MNFSLRSSSVDRVLLAHRALASAVRRAVARAGRAVWRALEAQGRARARLELRKAAERYALAQPDIARTLRAASRYDAGSV